MASFLKKHIGLIIFLIVIIIIAIVMFVFARSILISGSEGTIYGNRLEGISEINLNKDSLDKIVSDIKGYDYVKSASHRLEGKIINVMIDVANDTSIENAKKLVDPILSTLTDEEKSFYDIEVIIVCSENEESEVYPIIGYKHKTSSEFVW